MIGFIYKTITTNIAPMIYILMGVSVIIGFCFATGFLMGQTESVLYGTGVLVDKTIWGAILFCTSMTAQVGFVTRKKSLIIIGGMSGFLAWLFACIALALAGHWYVFMSVSLLHLLFHGYVYLAVSMGALERHPTESEL